jgi:FkbM family methyltransferase
VVGGEILPDYAATELLPLMALKMQQIYYMRGWGAGSHLSNFMRTMHSCSPNERITVIDCGAASYSASGGDVSHAELAATLWKYNAKVIGFEPGPTSFTKMQNSVSQLREISGADIIFENMAISDKEGTSDWFSSIEGGTDFPNIHGLEAHGTMIGSVQVTSLDQYTRGKDVEHINFLKVIWFIWIRCINIDCSRFPLSFL